MLSTHGRSMPQQPEVSDEELAEISTILGMWCGFDMSFYKDKCMKRRVAIRVRSTGHSSVADYCCLLRENGHERGLLQKVLTIHVSHFFRNPSVFEKLRDQVLPELFSRAFDTGQKEFRICSLGCASGEEPYSTAILLAEHFENELKVVPAHITGLDIDDATLAAARKGEYGEDRLREVIPHLRNKYFHPDGTRFRLIPEIREMVTFVLGNLTKPESYPPSDLLFCRNTLIYFTQPEQENILKRIAASIPPGGILVLGTSETLVGDVRRDFMPISLPGRIYRRIEPAGRPALVKQERKS